MRHARPFFVVQEIVDESTEPRTVVSGIRRQLDEFTEPRTVVSGIGHQLTITVTQPQIARRECRLFIPLATARGSVPISPRKPSLLKSLFPTEVMKQWRWSFTQNPGVLIVSRPATTTTQKASRLSIATRKPTKNFAPKCSSSRTAIRRSRAS